MNADKSNTTENLRMRAENLLAQATESFQPADIEDINKLHQELAVHQAELELQNEELKNTQESLRKLRDRYVDLFENAPVGYVLLDASGIIRYTNSIWGSMLERPDADFCGIPFAQTLVEGDAHLFLSRLRSLFNNPTEKHMELRIKRHDSEPFYAHITAKRSYDEHAERGTEELMVIVSDITKQKKAAEALREQRDFSENLIETAQSIILVLDPQGRIVRFNPYMEKLVGYKLDEVKGLDWFDTFIQPDSGDNLKSVFEKAVDDTPTRGNVNPIIAKDGRKIIIEWHDTALKDKDARTVGVLAIGQDITERKQAEEALRESEATVRKKLKSIVEPGGDIGTLELSDIIDIEFMQSMMEDFYRATGMLGAVLDLSGNVLVAFGWQDICTKFHRRHPDTLRNCIESDTVLSHGVAPGEVKSYKCKNNLWDVVTPLMLGDEHVGNVFIGQFFYKDEIPDEEVFRAQARQYGFDETEYLAALAQVPRFSREEVDAAMQFYVRLVKVVTTLSYNALKQARMLAEQQRAEKERESLQEQLLQSQKMESVGLLAGGVAHDFNNMLGVIIGHAEMQLRRMGEGDSGRKSVDNILVAARRSADLTRQLLAFASKQTIAPEVLDLNATVEGMLQMLRRLIGEDIDLVWNPGSNIPPVNMDPSQLDQILVNLCVNARDAIRDVGNIALETEYVVLDEAYCNVHTDAIPGKYILLAISDNGCGMDEEIRLKIFDPFYTTKDQGKGTGLGLSTVYGIVKQNEGFINVYSEPGRCTTFRIYIPIHHGEAEVESKTAALESIEGNGETILLVEDEPALLDMTCSILEELGYRVIPLGSPLEALAEISNQGFRPDLVVTDVIMPDMNGKDMAIKMLQICPGTQILFMSGYTANTIVHHGVLDKDVYFIQKPFSVYDLGMKVRDILRS